jgi:sulfopropanediol 3-dehydrogenase
MYYLKKAEPPTPEIDASTTAAVAGILAEIERDGEAAVRRLNHDFDGWDGDILVDTKQLASAGRRLPESVKADLEFARDRIRDFAQRQRDSMQEFETALGPGVVVGQRLVPVTTAGCYVPGGRYAHAASAIMSICTAKIAGVENVIAATPAHGDRGIHPAILYAMHLSGATQVLAAGGAQGVAALAFGIATRLPADIIVGPGNRFVAEAKRQLFGRVGIDVIAGPTENLVIADESADPAIVAADLAGQAEHGSDSPVWLITTSTTLGEAVLAEMPDAIGRLPEPARSNAAHAWRDHGEIVVAEDREEACKVSDDYAPEHLQVQAADLDWWHANLRNYGSLFLGEETTVAFGDKCSGPNHILPTRGAARYSGGLSVGKFIKVLSYQRMERDGSRTIGPVAARISRLEGMEGHARTGDVRLQKYYPGEDFELEPPPVDWEAGVQ